MCLEEGGRGFLVFGINGCERGISFGRQVADSTAFAGGGTSEIADLHYQHVQPDCPSKKAWVGRKQLHAVCYSQQLLGDYKEMQGSILGQCGTHHGYNWQSLSMELQSLVFWPAPFH
jgi:hypothetical protein